MGTVIVAVSWNIQQPLPEFKYLLLLPIRIHSKESISLMPWSLYTLHVSSQQCLGSYTAQTRARMRNAPGLQGGRSNTGPQEWDGEDIWEVLHQPASSATPSGRTHGGKWVTGAVQVMEFDLGKHLRQKTNASSAEMGAACTLEQQDGSWWHVWQEREQASLTAALLQSAFHQALLDLNTKVTWKMVTKFFFCKVLPFN